LYIFLKSDYNNLTEISIPSLRRRYQYTQNDEKKYLPSEKVKKARRREQKEYNHEYSRYR